MLYRISSPVRPYPHSCSRRLKPTILGRNLGFQRREIRMMILSDTHGDDLENVFLPRADVVLHCGDLTDSSRPSELERTLAMLRAIDAPLKLAIPGNHDFSLESGYWRRTRAHGHPTRQQQQDEDSTVLAQTSAAEDDADAKASWELLRRAARHDGIFLLPQGIHTFVLPGSDGARLRLFASPLTPRHGNWGFQYDRSNPHKWAIPSATSTSSGDAAVDVVMTHGPPRGIRDGTSSVVAGAGCAGLLAAVERARPRVHCFGHIHGAWGAEVVTWKRGTIPGVSGGRRTAAFLGSSAPIYSNLVDARRSWVVASLMPTSKTTTTDAGVGECSVGPPPARTTQRYHSRPREERHCCAVDISPDGEHAVKQGAQTLFVNAAVQLQSRPPRMPWLVVVDLPVAGEEDASAAAETMYRLRL